MKKCDVIIPIYNAFDCLSECIDSVIKNTDLKNSNIILINDKSTDKRVKPLLIKYSKENSNIIYIENKKNVGFVGTVNKGMSSSKNDVILLNSDTIVSKNWLKKMSVCAYSSERIATVTPLSNNATLVSVPKPFVENELISGNNFEETALIIEESSKKLYPELPTGHGFCLYIKREVIEKIGLFDQEKYGRGYGEENDFCFRCLDAGYTNVLCDDTYIYHKESQSFSDEKIKLIEKSMDILKKDYPNYVNNLNYWCSTKEIEHIGQSIIHYLAKKNSKKNVLFLIHDWTNVEKNLGGTTLHAYDLINKMKHKYNFHVLAPNSDGYILHSYIEDYETILNYPKINSFSNMNFYNKEYEKMIDEITNNFGIDIVHVHHMIGSYFNLSKVVKKNNLYLIVTIHDFYFVCPQINKLYKNEEYCSIMTNKKCSECLAYRNNRAYDLNNLVDNWNTECSDFLKKADMLIAPSVSARDEIQRTYPKLKINVIEHGVDISKEKAEKDVNKTRHDDIAFIGAIGVHKGSQIMYNLINYKKLGKLKIHLFGICDNPAQKSTRKFKMHGKYKRENLLTNLKNNNIKLICLFPIWPETYSYTLTEAIACGIPVITTNLGAVSERVKKYGLGWVVDYKIETKDLVDKIKSILSDEKEYNQILDNINNYKIKTTEEMADEYIKIYDKVVFSKKDYNTDEIYDKIINSKKNNIVVNYSNYEWVFDTLKWKIISKFKIPKSAKKFIKKFYGGLK